MKELEYARTLNSARIDAAQRCLHGVVFFGGADAAEKNRKLSEAKKLLSELWKEEHEKLRVKG